MSYEVLLSMAENDSSIRELIAVMNMSYDDLQKEFSALNDKWWQMAIIIVYAVVIIFGLFANLVVVIVIARYKQLHTVTNIFIINLAVADIALCVFNLPLQLHYQLTGSWAFGYILCHIAMPTFGVPVFVSSLSILMIALDRYILIVYPFKPRMKNLHAILSVQGILIFTIGLATPLIVYVDHISITMNIEKSEHKDLICLKHLDCLPFQAILCHIAIPTFGVPVFVSSLSILMIALDRYILIVYPFKPRMKNLHAILSVQGILIFTIGLATPLIVYVDHISITMNIEKTICMEAWPSYPEKQIYTVTVFLLQFFLPLCLTSFFYTHICIVLRNRPIKKHETRRNQRTNRILIAVVLTFTICWMPWNLFSLTAEFSHVVVKGRYFGVIDVLLKIFAMGSACVNPFLYGWLNDNFKKELGRLFGYRLCWSRNSSQPMTTMHSQATEVNHTGYARGDTTITHAGYMRGQPTANHGVYVPVDTSPNHTAYPQGQVYVPVENTPNHTGYVKGQVVVNHTPCIKGNMYATITIPNNINSHAVVHMV